MLAARALMAACKFAGTCWPGKIKKEGVWWVQECVIKFFTHRGAFEREKQLYDVQDEGLKKMMAAFKHLEANEDGKLLMAPGRPFPPCIVVEVCHCWPSALPVRVALLPIGSRSWHIYTVLWSALLATLNKPTCTAITKFSF
jgi:hypothetical protein